MDRGNHIYLTPTQTIDCNNPDIREAAVALTHGCMSDEDKAQVLFYFVRDEIHYNVYMLSTFIEDFRASFVLKNKKGYCVQKAILLAALLRAVGIPSRIAFARIRNHRVPDELRAQTGIDNFPSHGYTQLLLHEKWISVTPAFDKMLCEKLHVPSCDFDGEHDALFSGHDLHGNPYIEYLEKYEPQADLPFDWLHERIFPIWGHKRPWINDSDSKGHVMPLSGYRFSEKEKHIKPKSGYCIGCENKHGCKSRTPPCIDEMARDKISSDSGKKYLQSKNRLHLCRDCPFLRSCWTMSEYQKATDRNSVT